MIYILTGADSYTRTLKYEEIKNSLGNQEALATNTSIFDNDELTLDALTTACNAIPFLAEKRLVVVKGLLGSFEPKEGATRQKKTRKKNGQQKEQPNHPRSQLQSTDEKDDQNDRQLNDVGGDGDAFHGRTDFHRNGRVVGTRHGHSSCHGND